MSDHACRDAPVRRCAGTFYHTAGMASMGPVVDAECRVKGVAGLRVVDGSVVPTPISAHYMVVVYALAEQMAEIIVGKEDMSLGRKEWWCPGGDGA